MSFNEQVGPGLSSDEKQEDRLDNLHRKFLDLTSTAEERIDVLSNGDALLTWTRGIVDGREEK